jgi:hypothetical protein
VLDADLAWNDGFLTALLSAGDPSTTASLLEYRLQALPEARNPRKGGTPTEDRVAQVAAEKVAQKWFCATLCQSCDPQSQGLAELRFAAFACSRSTVKRVAQNGSFSRGVVPQ